MANIQENEQQIISEFDNFEDWMDKYNYLIEMGKSIPQIDESEKVEQNIISGCQSRVWLTATMEEGQIYFKGDSDAVITKGIANLLIRVLSGQSPEDIINTELDFIEKIGLREHLSPTRSNGLVLMIKQMKFYAMAFKAKKEKLQQ